MSTGNSLTFWRKQKGQYFSIYVSFSLAGLNGHIKLSWKKHAEGKILLPAHWEAAVGAQPSLPHPRSSASAPSQRISIISLVAFVA